MVVKKPRIVIVGAGMAGLTAAHRLYTSSEGLFDLSVVDGGDRIGGRILTAEFAGDRVEMGATWIHGIEGSPVYAMAGEIGALVEDSRPWERMDGFPSDPVTVAEGGGVVDQAAVVDPITSLYRRLMDAARSGEAEIVADGGGLGVGPFLRRGLRDYRASRAGGGGAIGAADPWDLEALEEAVFAMHECQERTCTSAEDLADLDLAAESEYRDFPGDQITIAKGYSRIVEHLAAALPDGTIRLGRRLCRIEWLPDGGGPVRLHFAGGDEVTADHVILTVSLGVLKAGGIEFDPALPAFKREAIGRLGFGLVNKLFMEMETEAEAEREREEFPYLQMAFPKEGHVAKIPRWMRRTQSICPIYGGSRVLLAWFVGKEAMQLEALDDEEVIRGAHATIDALLPPSVPARIAKPPDQRCNGGGMKCGGGGGGRIARVNRSGWGTDPLFLGSYSYVAVGSSGDDLDLMAEPLPRGGKGEDVASLQILFAGEATHRTHYSTTHGAYFSGIREANRLLQYYGSSNCSNIR